MPLKICYHGTDEHTAAVIRRHGFLKGTYFARHLENAIHMGGSHVFGVVFDEAELPPHWQFISRDAIPADRIAHYHVYRVFPMMSDDGLRQRVLESGLAMGQDYCDRED